MNLRSFTLRASFSISSLSNTSKTLNPNPQTFSISKPFSFTSHEESSALKTKALFSSAANRSISEAITANPKLRSNPKCNAGFKYFRTSLERTISNSGTLQKFRSQPASNLSLSRYGATGIQIKKHSLHSLSWDVDGFSELGAPLQNRKGGPTLVNFATERPQSAKASIRAANAEHAPKCEDSNSIAIKKVPVTISLSQLTEAVSEFGEISNASMITGSDGFNSCHVEFESEESKRRAVASRGIFVESLHLPIYNMESSHLPTYNQEDITIRIKNIGMNVAESSIHSVCMACGSVKGLSRTKDDCIDVFFTVNSSSERESLLEKLNGMSIDNCQWSAEILQESTDFTVQCRNVNDKLGIGLKLTNCLKELIMQSDMKNIYLEDLVYLQQVVRHLEENPSNRLK